MRAEHACLLPGYARRVDDVAEVAADEQTRWPNLKAPDAIDGVEVRVPGQQVAVGGVKRPQFASYGGVRVGRIFDVAVWVRRGAHCESHVVRVGVSWVSGNRVSRILSWRHVQVVGRTVEVVPLHLVHKVPVTGCVHGGCGGFEGLYVTGVDDLPEQFTGARVLANRVARLRVPSGSAASSDVHCAAVGGWAYHVEVVLLAEGRGRICYDRRSLHPRRNDIAVHWVERSEFLGSGTGDVVEVAAHPQHVVDVEFYIEDAEVGCADPVGIKVSRCGVELHQIRCRDAVHGREVAADPHRRSVCGDGVDACRNVGIKCRIDRAGDGVELGKASLEASVDVGEGAADVEILFVGRKRNPVHCKIAASWVGDDGCERGVNMASSNVDGRQVGAGLASHLREIASEVIQPVGFKNLRHRCAAISEHTCRRRLGWVDAGRS